MSSDFLNPRMAPRPDAAAKLSGRLVYRGDVTAPGCLVGKVLRSPHPHARVLSVDTSAAEAMPGVHAVITARDVPPGFLYGIQRVDQPVLAVDRVRMIGEPVAAVAAETEAIALAARDAIRVEYEPLPVLSDPEAALSPEAIALHPGGNLCHTALFERGDLAAGFARAAHVVEGVYETPRQMHVALELEAGIAIPGDDGRLVVHAPCQHPHGIQRILARVLGWDPARIDVIGDPVGGSYGGKEDPHVQPVLALLAVKAGRPVKIVLSRAEASTCGIKRHPFRIRMRTGCDGAGRLVAHEVEALADTGAFASHGPEVLDTAHENGQGHYRIGAVKLSGRLAYTNNGISGAFRGFGALQMQVALESQIERLAHAAGIDPVRFRTMNLRAADALGPLGQPVLPQPEVAEVGRRLVGWRARLAAPPAPGPRFLTGVGTALVTKGEGFAGGAPNAAWGALALADDGRIELRTGLTDMGQGALAAMPVLVARTLGVATADARGVTGDTRRTADAGPTSASRGTQVASRLARIAAPGFRARVLVAASRMTGLDPDDIMLGPGGIHLKGGGRNAPVLDFATLAAGAGPLVEEAFMPAIETYAGIGDAHVIFTTCGAIARVVVDRWTGRIRAERIAVVPAGGPVLSPEAFKGQIEGGAIMALGFVLTEDLPARDGRFLADNLDRYLVPTLADSCPVDVDPVEELAADDPIGFRGVGEIAMNAVGPALATAVFDALGTAPKRLPVDPAWVLDVLEESGR
ncbi:xanthine dehydrogenase family protein molybdopterin-binding subunit [Segnochrobactraceae bacterium EtOH-i3]